MNTIYSEMNLNSYYIIKTIVHPIIKAMIDITPIGGKNIPKKNSYILIANHRSDLDPLVISVAFPRYIAWVADSFMFNIPFVEKVLIQTGCIPVDTTRTAQLNLFRSAKSIFNKKHCLGIFPEGHDTMAQNKQHLDLGEFHSGFTEMALRFKIPIIPISILTKEESLEPLVIPSFLIDILKPPKDLLETKNRVVYKKVNVFFHKPVPIEPYIEKIEKNSKESFKQVQNQLVQDTHKIIKSKILESKGKKNE